MDTLQGLIQDLRGEGKKFGSSIMHEYAYAYAALTYWHKRRLGGLGVCGYQMQSDARRMNVSNTCIDIMTL